MMVSLNHFNKMVLNVKEREEMYKKVSDVDHEVRQNYAGPVSDTHQDVYKRQIFRYQKK